jgi:hypothetical protein
MNGDDEKKIRLKNK